MSGTSHTVIRSIALSALVTAVAACASAGPQAPTLPSVSREALLSGAALFETPATAELPSTEEILGIDDEMRAFVRAEVGGARDPQVKLERLLAGMRDRGLLSLDYLASATQTVRETFHERQGNCLSFTLLFVALAREAGLEVSYQMVDIPPTWSSTPDIITRNNHINTVVASGGRANYVVDFNSIAARGNYDARTVSDRYALALFYSNVGAAAFVRREYATSLVFFREAISTYPDLTGPWNNLGVLYSRHGLLEHAESAYLEGLAVDADDPSVLTNLAILYGDVGDETQAETYRRRVRHYRQRNPYYYYSVAMEAYDEDRLRDALGRLRKAIRLKPDEHQFHYLRGLTHFRLGDRRKAADDFEQALRHARYTEVRAQYEIEIRGLGGG